MPRSTDRILTTHAGSLPRPEDVVEVIWAAIGRATPPTRPSSTSASTARCAEIVAKQREAGIDIVSDGELSKPGFSTYINDRFTGFEGRSGVPGRRRRRLPEPRDARCSTRRRWRTSCSPTASARSTGRTPTPSHATSTTSRARSGGRDRSRRSWARSPGQIAFNFPDHHYGSHEEYLAALGRRAARRVQGDHRRRLQPADRLARPGDGRALPLGRLEHRELAHAPAAGDRGAQRGARRHPRRSRCACTSAGATTRARTTRTSRSRDIVEPVLKANAGTIYVEGANPRHEHEWEVFKDVELPDGKVLILGVIDVKVELRRAPAARRPAARPLRRGRRPRERASPAPTAASTPSSASRRSTRTSCGSSCRRSPRARRSRPRSSGARPTAAASRRRRRGSRR